MICNAADNLHAIQGLGIGQASTERPLPTLAELADDATSIARPSGEPDDMGSEQGTTPLAKQQPGRGNESTQASQQSTPLQAFRRGLTPIKRLKPQKKEEDMVSEAGMGKQRMQPQLDGMIGVDALPGQPVFEQPVIKQPVNEQPLEGKQSGSKRHSRVQTPQPADRLNHSPSASRSHESAAASLQAHPSELRQIVPPPNQTQSQAVEAGKSLSSGMGPGNGSAVPRESQGGATSSPAEKQRTGMGFGKPKEVLQGSKRVGGRGSSAAKLKQQPVAPQGSLMDVSCPFHASLSCKAQAWLGR